MSLEPPSEPPPGASAPVRFRFGDVEVDVGAMRVVRGGVPVELEPKVFDLLVFLARNPGRVVGKEEILERVWDGAFVTDNALARAVAQLRRALGDDAAHARYIETVRTRGYRFVADVEPRDPSSVQHASQPARGATLPAVVPAAPEADASDGESSVFASRVVALVLAAVVLITVALASRQLLRAARIGVERRAAVTGEPRQLTVSPGYDGGPTFSPDGRYLAFSSERKSAREASGEESGDSRAPAAPANESTAGELAPEIVVRRLQDGEELQLTRDGSGNVDPAWSPDDRWIAYHSMSRGGLWLVSPLGGTPRRLTEFGSQPEWSPDAKSVVFCSQAATALAPWSWAASRDALLWVVDVDSGALRQLTQPGQPAGGHGEPAWSPDGRNVVFSAGDELGHSSLWRVEAAGGQPMELEATSSPGEGKQEKMDWRSPVFVTADTLLAVRSTRGYSVWRLPLWGAVAAVEVLPVAPDGIGSLSLAPAGDFLAFAEHAASSRIVSVTLGPDGRPLESRDLATASRRMSNPSFSPDGRKLLYSRARGGASPDVLVLDLESGVERSLEGLDGYPLWSSESSLVTWGAAGATSIDLDTGQRRKLEVPGSWLASGDRYRAAFRTPTPDLVQVVFGARLEESPAALELFVWRAGEAEPRQLTELGAFSEFPNWSRDGRRLVFQVSRPERPEHDELWVADVDGGAPPQRVLRLPGRSWGPAFDARGERVVYAAQRRGRWDLAIAGVASSSGDGKSEQLLQVNRDYMAYIRWPDWSPVDDRIAFEHTQMSADVWLLPLRPARPASGDS